MAFYDLALADSEGFFSARMRELCGAHDLSFFLVEPLWLREFLTKVIRGDIGVGVLIDEGSDPYNPTDLYYRLAREVKASGGHVIDDPDRSVVAAHKGKFHAILVKNSVPVPETIIIRRNDLPGFCITDELTARIGMPFVVKPGWGSGGQGVILDACSEADVRRSAERAPTSDSFLLQRRLRPQTLEGRVGWFRVFHVCGEIIPCWWNQNTGEYEMVSPNQRRRFGLQPLEQIVHKIADLSGMELFSTEIALTDEGQCVAVDYVNDECDTHPKSYWPSGVPDELVRRIAWLLNQRAITVLHKHSFERELVERDTEWQERQQRKP